MQTGSLYRFKKRCFFQASALCVSKALSLDVILFDGVLFTMQNRVSDQTTDQNADRHTDKIDPDVRNHCATVGEYLQRFVQKSCQKSGCGAVENVSAKAEHQQKSECREFRDMRDLSRDMIALCMDSNEAKQRIDDMLCKPAAFACGYASRKERLGKDERSDKYRYGQQNDPLCFDPFMLSRLHAALPSLPHHACRTL